MKKIPYRFVFLMVAAVCTFLACFIYTLLINPEVVFWKSAAELKLRWMEQMRQKHGYVIAIVGGSTTAFGIDAQAIENRSGLPVVNMGVAVGCGQNFITRFGLLNLKRGDTLIISLEPGILSDPFRHTALGSQVATALGCPSLVSWNEQQSMTAAYASIASDLRPGFSHLITMLAKIASNRELYRYSLNDAIPGGLQTTSIRNHFQVQNTGEVIQLHLSKDAIQLLNQVKNACHEKGISLYYLMPWRLEDKSRIEQIKITNRNFLDQISQITPIIYEPQLGIHVESKDFSDTEQHLTRDAAYRRSLVLADTLVKELKKN